MNNAPEIEVSGEPEVKFQKQMWKAPKIQQLNASKEKTKGFPSLNESTTTTGS